MSSVIPDAVWGRLDPNAGSLTRRARRRLWIAFGTSALLFVTVMLVLRAGLVVPRLVWDGYAHEWTFVADRMARVNIEIRNGGRFAATVESLGSSGPGLELIGAEGIFPVRLEPGDGMLAVLTYRVTDCNARASQPLVARVRVPWGTMNVDVLSDAPVADYWQSHIASTGCIP